MDELFAVPGRIVYVHPVHEQGRDLEVLRSKVPFETLPFGITDLAGCTHWMRTVLKVDSVLSSKGWMKIPAAAASAPLLATFEVHVRRAPSGGASDKSKEWVCTVLRPYPFAVLDVADLRRALEEPLALPLPIGPAAYENLDPSYATQFIPTDQYPAERISGCVTNFINAKVTLGMSENLLQSIWDEAFCNLWMNMLDVSEITSIQFNRNVTDPSGASTRNVRPDLLLWILNRLCIKFEEKRKTLEEAFQDLIKLSVLPPQYYGPVQWIIGVGLAGSEMAGWALRQGQVPDDLFGRLNMTSLRDKATCLRLSINFLRVAFTVSDIYSRLSFMPRPFTTFPPAFYGSLDQITRSLSFVCPKVIKEIEPWSQHVAEGFTTTAFVTQAYGLGAAARGLVSGDVKVTGERYKVVIHSMGYEQMVSSGDELLTAIKDVLHGLHALHQAGLVHRDIRWKNILKRPGNDGGWMLIDLETVWKTGSKPRFWLRAWDENTLVNGLYTESSDLYLVGRLMDSFHNLSPKAKQFRAELLGHEFESAQKALHHLAQAKGTFSISD